MKKFSPFAVLAVAVSISAASPVLADETESVEAAQAPVQLEIKKGVGLYGQNGRRIGSIYSVTENGLPQVIIGSYLITVPSSSLSEVDGKLTTSLTKRELERLK